jgi:hypothetical protein
MHQRSENYKITEGSQTRIYPPCAVSEARREYREMSGRTSYGICKLHPLRQNRYDSENINRTAETFSSVFKYCSSCPVMAGSS